MKHRSTLLLLAMLAACTTTPEEARELVAERASQATRVAAGDPFPLPRHSLSIPAPDPDGSEPTLASLLEALEGATGLEVLASSAALRQSLDEPIGLLSAAEVSAPQLYPFVEGILRCHGLGLSVLPGSAPSVVELYSNRGNAREESGRRAWIVPPELLPSLAAHPAVLIATEIELPHCDVRLLANSLRTIQGGNAGLQSIHLGETRQLWLEGFATDVAELAELLRGLDAREGKRTPPPEVKPESKAGKSEAASEG